MALVQRVKRVLRNGYAAIINDKRPLPAYSYGWLNRLCGYARRTMPLRYPASLCLGGGPTPLRSRAH